MRDNRNELDNLMIPLDEETEYIPLLSEEEEEDLKKMNIPDVLPILPLRNTVLFPGMPLGAPDLDSSATEGT